MTVSMQEEVTRLENTTGVEKGSEFANKPIVPDLVTFEPGDQFTVPSDAVVYTVPIGTNKGQFILVDVKNKNTNEESCKRFYPTSLNKWGMIVNEDGTKTGKRMAAKGSARSLYMKAQTVDAGFKNLIGKKIEYTTEEEGRVHVVGQPANQTRMTRFGEWNVIG
jgi:hypothetical protein